jgi:hypothetical protein
MDVGGNKIKWLATVSVQGLKLQVDMQMELNAA